jgi:hypothetical protein
METNMHKKTLILTCIALGGCSGASLGESRSLALLSDATSITQNADGTFTVVCKNGTSEIDTAAQIQHNQICLQPAANPADPFDPASCTGPALTQAEANQYLDLTNGVQDIKVGRFQVYRRWRKVYPGWPAGAWQTVGVDDIVSTYNFEICTTYTCSGYSFYADSTNGLAKVPLQGEVHVDYDNSRPVLSLYGDNAPFTHGLVQGTVAFVVDDWDFTTSSIPAPSYNTSTPFNSSGVRSSPLDFAGIGAFTFSSAVAAPTCVRFAFDGFLDEYDSDGNLWKKETQLVVLGTIGS